MYIIYIYMYIGRRLDQAVLDQAKGLSTSGSLTPRFSARKANLLRHP